MKAEAKLESDIRLLAKNLGIKAVKLTSNKFDGIPDHMFEYNGRVLYIEFKNPIHLPKASYNQTRARDNARKRGTPSFITADFKFCFKLLNTLVKNPEELKELKDEYYDS